MYARSDEKGTNGLEIKIPSIWVKTVRNSLYVILEFPKTL